MRSGRWCAAAIAIASWCSAAVAEPVDPAQAIAQKFSEASEPSKPAEKSSPPAAAAKPVAAQPAAATAKSPEPPKSAAPATRPDLDYEMDMLRRARVEADERKAPPALAATKVATPEPVKVLEPAPPKATVAAPAEAPATKNVEVEPAPAAKSPPPAAATPAPAQTQAAPPATAAAPKIDGPQATVLLALEGRDGAGSNAAPDLIICVLDTCYVSAGIQSKAIAVPRAEALTLKGTAERSRESCRGMFGCVYRGVTIPKDALISVIDLSTSGGGDTSTYSIKPDATCAVSEGELGCGNGLVTHSFRAWVVPEAAAEKAGIQLIEDAVAEGLIADSDVSSKDK